MDCMFILKERKTKHTRRVHCCIIILHLMRALNYHIAS